MIKRPDSTANSTAVSATLGASNLTEKERGSYDFYATEPKAVELLLKLEKFEGKIWECCCGEGHLSKAIEQAGYEVRSSDIIQRNYPCEIYDFLSLDNHIETDYNIITNPPYKLANQFIERGNDILKEGNKMALFMPIRYLEGKQRKFLFKKYPMTTVYISSGRLICAINGDFKNQTGSAMSYAWYVWQKGYKGDTILKWFN